MRGRGFLATGVVMLLLAASVSRADEPGTLATDSSPWHVSKVTKLNSPRPGVAAADQTNAQKYLHIEVKFNVSPDAQKKHKFRIVNERGDEVGDLWGWNDGRSLVIFEGNWATLSGLYLDGIGHREPLFSTPAPRANRAKHAARSALRYEGSG